MSLQGGEKELRGDANQRHLGVGCRVGRYIVLEESLLDKGDSIVLSGITQVGKPGEVLCTTSSTKNTGHPPVTTPGGAKHQ